MIVKRIFYVVLAALVTVACSQSPEQKAETLIKENLKKSLYKPETYKPVETKIDSAFAPYDDPVFLGELAELGKMETELETLESEVKNAKSSMSLWSGPYMSAYERNQYQEVKEEYEEANAKIEKLKTKGRKLYEKVATMLQSEPKFIGYKAMHNYRADNNAGNTLIGNTFFFIDKNFEEITYSMEVEEYNQVQETIRQLKEQIEEDE
ncbi:hypothetical protein C3V39_06810 [Prevotella sp. oral taxon 820]|nr:hypothetical protein C3V39_06810 [Prevotella sp. oral taxon 820]